MGAVNASRTAAMKTRLHAIFWGDTHGTETESLGRHTLAKSRDLILWSDLPNTKHVTTIKNFTEP